MLSTRDLPLLVVFTAIAKRGSITKAAHDLGLSKSVISENLRALEDRCGVRLVERSTRSLKLTQVGEHVLTVAKGVADATHDIDGILEEHRHAPVGTLRVATTHDLSARLVAPAVAEVSIHYKGFRADIVSDDATHDLIDERFDLAVRLGSLRDSSLVMRKLATFEEIVVCAPSLVAQRTIARPRDLADAPWVRHALLDKSRIWKFVGPRGEKEEVGVAVRGQANTGEGVRALLLGGMGFGVLPEYLAAADLRTGALVRACPDWHWREVTLYAVLPSAAKRPKRVDLFVDALSDAASRLSA